MPKSSVLRLLALVALVVVASLGLFAGPATAAVEGTGMHFEITDSDYLNITLDSSEPVTVVMDSIPESVTIHIEAAEGAAEAQLALGGFEPDTEYHLYQDDFHNHTAFTTDASGSYSYTQDLSVPWLVMIQPRPSTYFLKATGWEDNAGHDPGIGTWNAATKTGTLTQDISQTIQIDDSGVTLDGNGHTSAGTLALQGVFVKQNVTGAVVRNLTITGYSHGIDIGKNNCSALTLTGNWISNCSTGIYLFKCDYAVITGNTVASCSTGIGFQTDYNAIGNTICRNSFIGNTTQAAGSGNGVAFAFNLAAPTGGNYWSNWTSPDSNHDGFVDSPYVFSGGQDNLPWAVQNGWETTPPTTTASLAGTVGSNGWYISAVTVTLSATDNPGGSGVHSTEYQLDGGAWTTYAGPFSIGADGSHTLSFRSTDNAGNVEAEHSQSVKVDTTPPVVSAQAAPGPNGNLWNNTDVTVTFTATDATSGVDSSSITSPVTRTSEGAAQLVSGSARDLAGNSATAGITVSIDKTPPTISGAATFPPNGNNGWYKTDAIVHFTASDALSGPPTVTPDVAVSTEGANQSATGTATDKAGNSASYTVSGLNIDKMPPVTSASLAGTQAGGWYRSEVVVTLSAVDGNSGVASTEYQLDGGAWTPYTAPFSVSGEGAHTLSYRSTDRAGNAEAAKSGGAISIDKTPPTTTADLAGTVGDNGWYRSEVVVTLNASDGAGGSGVGSTEYAIDGGGWTAYSAPFTVATEGVHQVHRRSTDKAGNVEAEQIQTVKIDWTPPTITGTRTPDANAYGWNNSDVTVEFAVSDAGSGIDGLGPADVVVSQEGGGQSVTRDVKDLAGNIASATVSGISIDKTPPTIDGAATSPPNAHGWYKNDVTVHFTGADSLSGVDSLTSDQIISAEGANQSVAGTITDKAGNTAAFTVTGINMDKTPPVVGGGATEPANSYGWYSHDVTVKFTASDSLSGVNPATAPADAVFTTEAAGQSATRTVADLAGNTTEFTVSDINIDKTPPTITGMRAPDANAHGWNNTDVSVHFEGADSLSGVASVTPDTLLVAEGAGQSVEGTVSDKAGNTASATVSGINIDKTPPVITSARTPEANSYGWNKTDVRVTFDATDAVSGVDQKPSPVTLTSEGANQSATGSATDLAGNTTSVTVTGINIDKTKPEITGMRTPGPNANGWNNTDVTAKFSGSDALSGVASLTPDTTLGADGANQSVIGTITDKAGNIATFAVGGINIDETPPVIMGSRTPGANSYGWNNSDVTVSFAVSDALSGIDGPAPADVTLGAEGSGQSVTRSITDKAGNTASATVAGINIDRTPPTIDGAATTPPNANGWYKSDVTIHFEGADGLSGVATITPDTIISTEGANQSVKGTVVDKAGNVATYTLAGINIDKTPPIITLTLPVDGASYSLRAVVTANWSAADNISAVDTATGTVPSGGLLDTAAVGDHSFKVTATDLSGNTAEKSVVYHVRYIYSGVLPPINLDGTSVFKLNSTVPTKIRLTDASGALVTNAIVTLFVAKLSNNVLGDELVAVSTAAATTGNLFRCDGSQYIFNLNTKPLSVGTWQMRIAMDDGNSDIITFSLR